jgi:hypothetical protein
LIIEHKTVHIFANFSLPAIRITRADGKEYDEYWEKRWEYLRILCNANRVIILKGIDTLYNGNYGRASVMKCKELLNSNNALKRSSNMRIVFLNMTCDTRIKRLSEIADYFQNPDQIYFQLGNGFACTDTLTDLRVHTGDFDVKPDF